MIVLDTNVVSELLGARPASAVVRWVSAIEEDVAVTAMTLAELRFGVRRLPDARRRTELENGIARAIEPFERKGLILSFDADGARVFADVCASRERIGRPIHTADAVIAATCIANGAVLATRNTKDFDGTGVRLIDPWTA